MHVAEHVQGGRTLAQLPLAEMEDALKALANINRLRLLIDLQEPKGYGDIELSPSREDPWGSGRRSISRQAIRGHLEPLIDLELVQETDSGPGRTKTFIVDHGRLFTLVEQMRQLATVRPTVPVGGGTMDLDAPLETPEVEGPHLVLVRGVEEGRTFPLEEPPEEDRWAIGRDRETSVPLDYDPYVSGTHAYIVEKDEGFFLVDDPDNKNGTFLNWSQMTDGGVAPLSPGDVIGVGMSLLVFRE